MKDTNGSNLSRPGGAAVKEDNMGPVPMRHLMRQGKGDGVSNPFGSDAPSSKNMIGNNQGKTY